MAAWDRCLAAPRGAFFQQYAVTWIAPTYTRHSRKWIISTRNLPSNLPNQQGLPPYAGYIAWSSITEGKRHHPPSASLNGAYRSYELRLAASIPKRPLCRDACFSPAPKRVLHPVTVPPTPRVIWTAAHLGAGKASVP